MLNYIQVIARPDTRTKVLFANMLESGSWVPDVEDFYVPIFHIRAIHHPDITLEDVAAAIPDIQELTSRVIESSVTCDRLYASISAIDWQFCDTTQGSSILATLNSSHLYYLNKALSENLGMMDSVYGSLFSPFMVMDENAPSLGHHKAARVRATSNALESSIISFDAIDVIEVQTPFTYTEVAKKAAIGVD